MAEAVAERGYAKTSVADVLRRARVSRESFYEHYANKEACFLAAYDAAAATVLGAVADSTSTVGTSGSADPIEEMLARYLDMLAEEPAIARTFLIEVYAAGPAALARRVEVQERFVASLAETLGARTPSQRFACEALVAATSGLVTQRICAGRAGELRDLHTPLVADIKAVLADHGLL